MLYAAANKFWKPEIYEYYKQFQFCCQHIPKTRNSVVDMNFTRTLKGVVAYSGRRCSLMPRCKFLTVSKCPSNFLASSFLLDKSLQQPTPFLATSGTLSFQSFSNARFFSASSSGASNVLVLSSDDQVSTALTKAEENGSVAVLYFTASWCQPCKLISPFIDNLSKSHSNITFLKLDIDGENLLETLRTSAVSAVPSFHFYKNGAKVADLVGANPDRLKEIIEDLAK